MEKLRLSLPQEVRAIIEKLQENGFEAYAVGGCVRDSLIGRTPEDWDITTSAHPQEMKRIFPKTIDTGLQHGTVTVLMGRKDAYSTYEVTTYRIDGEYQDGRHPSSVSFTPSLLEDLKRRDFTINAMAYNESRGLIDAFGGISDLENGVIRCVGAADERFAEDALRILRAVRFAAQLGFQIEAETERAICRHTENLEHVSKERIQAELSKLLCSAHPARIKELFRLAMAGHICSGFLHAQTDGFSEEAEEIPLREKYLRYAVLCTGMQEKEAALMLRELRLDNDTTAKVLLLSAHVLKYIPNDRYALKKTMQQMTPQLMRELLELKKKLRELPAYQALCRGEDIAALSALLEDVLRREEPVYLSDLAVHGSDLIAAGLAPGPAIGRILGEMLDDVLHTPVHNSILYLLSQHLKTV